MRRFFAFVAAVAAVLTAGPSIARPLVAVIDSGVARTAELGNVVIAEYDVASAAAPRAAFQPRYDHGTMVATIIHRETKGAADIISFRMDDPNGCPPSFAPPCQFSPHPVAAAIRKATELNVDVINISLALQEHPVIVEAVREAAAKGVMVVMAAGNNGYDRPSNRNAALAGGTHAVLVGAIDKAGLPWSGTNRPEAASAGYEYVWRLGVMVPTRSAAGAAVAGTGTSFAAPIEAAYRLMALDAARTATAAASGGAAPVTPVLAISGALGGARR